MLHGWLDNAASFTRLGPALADHYQVIAVDLPGHGASEHRPTGADYNLLDYVVDIADLLKHLAHRQPVHLIGHSLGGIIASLTASVMPEALASLTMIDSLGPYTATDNQFTSRLRRAVLHRLRDVKGTPALFARVEDAMVLRQSGPIALSEEASRLIVTRNLETVPGGYRWRTDPRLRDPSLSFLTEGQVEAYFSKLSCPAMLVEARRGLVGRYHDPDRRRRALPELVHAVVEGSHHCHLETESAPIVAERVMAFLQETDPRAETSR